MANHLSLLRHFMQHLAHSQRCVAPATVGPFIFHARFSRLLVANAQETENERKIKKKKKPSFRVTIFTPFSHRSANVFIWRHCGMPAPDAEHHTRCLSRKLALAQGEYTQRAILR